MPINAAAVFIVQKLVELKPPAISKCFPTLRTSIKFLSCMDPEVSTPKIENCLTGCCAQATGRAAESADRSACRCTCGQG